MEDKGNPPHQQQQELDDVGSIAGGGEEEPFPPESSSIVFQCAACRRIIGDSFALINADEDLRNITLQGASGIVRSPCTRTSEDGKDLGSTYHELFCEGCNAALGKVYLTTAPALDGVRNLFTFNTDALESYQLGTYDHNCVLPPRLEAAMLATKQQSQQQAARGEEPAPSPQIQMELTKLQNMMLVFHDRISTLEKAWKAFERGGKKPSAQVTTAIHGSSSSGSSENVAGVGNKRKKR